jgi:branched-chain amino acid transport system permease protein
VKTDEASAAVPDQVITDGPTLNFRPMNFGRWFIWGLTAIVFLALPMIFEKKFALALMSQAGIMIIFALSYNMLLGQSGMLSFGHAVYSGLGAYFAIHAMNLLGKGSFFVPVSLLPLVGGLAGLVFGCVFGWLTTRKAGTPFAMITLGLGEMVFAASLMFPGFFGGEAGINGNRTAGPPFLGIAGLTFGRDLHVYYLIAVWCFASMVTMFALTATPLGRIANAVRDNPERAEFIGYNTQRVRWLMLMLSAFFAGIAGGLMAINLESVGSEAVSAIRSGGVLLAAFIGGVAFFFGPILGAIVFVFFSIALSEFTKAWQLYLGVFFVLLVMFAPGGLSSLILMNLRVLKFGKMKRLLDPYVGVLLSGLALLAGVVLLIEFTWHRTLDLAMGPVVKIAGFAFNTDHPQAWALAATTALAAAAAFEYMRRQFKAEWDRIQVEIEDWLRDNPEDR